MLNILNRIKQKILKNKKNRKSLSFSQLYFNFRIVEADGGNLRVIEELSTVNLLVALYTIDDTLERDDKSFASCIYPVVKPISPYRGIG